MSNSNKIVRNQSDLDNKKTVKGKHFYFIGGAAFIILGIILREYATVGIGIAIIASYILGQIYKKTISKW